MERFDCEDCDGEGEWEEGGDEYYCVTCNGLGTIGKFTSGDGVDRKLAPVMLNTVYHYTDHELELMANDLARPVDIPTRGARSGLGDTASKVYGFAIRHPTITRKTTGKDGGAVKKAHVKTYTSPFKGSFYGAVTVPVRIPLGDGTFHLGRRISAERIVSYINKRIMGAPVLPVDVYQYITSRPPPGPSDLAQKFLGGINAAAAVRCYLLFTRVALGHLMRADINSPNFIGICCVCGEPGKKTCTLCSENSGMSVVIKNLRTDTPADIMTELVTMAHVLMPEKVSTKIASAIRNELRPHFPEEYVMTIVPRIDQFWSRELRPVVREMDKMGYIPPVP